MKKSDVRLIIVGISSLVIAILLTIATVISLFVTASMSIDTEKVSDGVNRIESSIQEFAESFDSDTDIVVEARSEGVV